MGERLFSFCLPLAVWVFLLILTPGPLPLISYAALTQATKVASIGVASRLCPIKGLCQVLSTAGERTLAECKGRTTPKAGEGAREELGEQRGSEALGELRAALGGRQGPERTGLHRPGRITV